MSLSDFPCPSIPVVRRRLPGADLATIGRGQAGDLPVPARGAWHACMGSQTARSPDASRASDAPDVAFRHPRARRHSGSERSFAAQYPARIPPVNASPMPSRAPAHDSGPVWLARPSPYDSFIRYSSPVTGAFRGISLGCLWRTSACRHSRRARSSPALSRKRLLRSQRDPSTACRNASLRSDCGPVSEKGHAQSIPEAAPWQGAWRERGRAAAAVRSPRCRRRRRLRGGRTGRRSARWNRWAAVSRSRGGSCPARRR